MMADECVPVKVALELMDTSSLGLAHKYDSFKYTHNDLQQALQSIVNDYYQGFNSSIGTYHSIMRSITTSQEKVRALREQLMQAKSDLSLNKPEVKNLVVSSQRYDEMLTALTAMEQLQGVPEKLEARISEKRFITAVSLLAESLKTIRQPEMMEIGALGDLRAYLSNQEVSLSDILIEELHNHLYLKSLYCVDRWKPYSPTDNAAITGEAVTVDGAEEVTDPGAQITIPAQRPLHKFLASADLQKPMTDDGGNKNPEADSLNYIRLLLESLHSLGYLTTAIGTINQRLPVELFKLVDKTNLEVDQRHPSSLLNLNRARKFGKTIDMGMGENDVRVTVLYDLLWTLYSKFEAVMEGHRVVYDVLKGIGKRENWPDTSLANGFVEVWQLIQSEMRSLLHDYLTANESRGPSNAPKSTQNINNIVAGKAFRDKGKNIFKLANVDYTSASMKVDKDDLEAILKASVPGLVSESLRPAASSSETQSSSDGAATGHKLLIEPSVFNMGLLLPPSLAFLQRVKEIVPAGSGIALSTLTSFLDDFLVNVFHPSLDDTMHDLFSQVTSDIDAFQLEPQWMVIAKKPVMKGTASFYNLITAFCKMLETIPPDQAFGELIIDLLTSYYGKCWDWYKELVSRNRAATTEDPTGEFKGSAKWAQNTEIKKIMGKIWTDKSESKDLLEQENALELQIVGQNPISSAELIRDRKTISALCTLYTSMKWLASKITQLRQVEESEAFAKPDSGSASVHHRQRRRWTLGRQQMRGGAAGGGGAAVQETPPVLPMSKDTVALFDGVVTSYQELASTILFTLRAETRCQVLHHLHLCMSGSSFNIPAPPPPSSTSPSPTIVTHEADINLLNLNTTLVLFDEDTSPLLRERERKYLAHGLGTFMDDTLVHLSPKLIKSLTPTGADKMLLNILVLQQNLKNIEQGVVLERARRFFELFKGGIQGLIATVKEGGCGFTWEEVRGLVGLLFQEGVKDGGSAVAAKKGLNEALTQLAEAWEIGRSGAGVGSAA
ncbi:Sec8 exocyst complex component-specific domain-containing protein [Peziza echinospora]|nr:Sec8 exocyst complex component-specific domain-containing protein [Peziza echinospora]